MRLELAPAAVIRAAAWPIESLDAFGERPGARYEDVIDRERAALWERTAGDPRFVKALVFASPSLLQRVQQHGGPGAARTKRTRHLETSLYRYLSRASTCTTPHGLWAGVTLAPFGERERVARAPARVDFTPNLAPFASALAALGARVPYREAARFRLSATLRPRPPGPWRFLARALGGAIDLREIADDPALRPFLERLADAGAGTLDELAARSRTPRSLLDSLIESGALTGGLSFPTQLASAWDALHAAGDMLLTADRAAWTRCVTALFEVATRLGRDFDELSAAELTTHAAEAKASTAALMTALGVTGVTSVDVALRAPALRCDLGLPFAVTLGAATRTELTECLTAYQSDVIDRLSPMSAVRRQRRRALAALLAERPVAFGDELPPTTFDPNASERDASRTLQSPWGCLVAQLAPVGRGARSRVIGIEDSPIRPFARHGSLLGANHDAERWVGELIARLEAEHGVVVADLALPFEANPNVLARPNLARVTLEPWGLSGPELRGAELRSERGALLLHVPGVGRVMAVATSSANTLSSDPLAAALAMTGFTEPIDATLFGLTPPAPRDSHAPLQELAALPRHERYARWRDLADRYEWPAHVAVSIGGRRPLVVPTRSPLAVEAAFEGAGDGGEIVVDETDVSARLEGPSGHHIADVTVPFSRDPHGFSTLTPEK